MNSLIYFVIKSFARFMNGSLICLAANLLGIIFGRTLQTGG